MNQQDDKRDGTDHPGGALSPVEKLLDQLNLEELDVNLFRGDNPAERRRPRVFGGLVAAQALRAATRTVEVDHHPHSLHGYFLRGGKPGRPIVYHVHRIRDGRSFTTRRVVAMQYGEAVFNLTASFQKFEEDDVDYQPPLPSDLPPPEDVPPRQPRDEAHKTWMAESPFEAKEVGPGKADEHGFYQATRRVWMRAKSAMPEDPLLHACALTYATDMGAVSGAAVPVFGEDWAAMFGKVMSASLDHAVWFHRPVSVDQWLYYEMQSISNQNSRGLIRGTIHGQDGRLVASMTQEALIRKLRPAAIDPELG
ncbi:MAG: acyl-CoA thioesterase domain-containing protein [Actinomycetota bacterium]